MAENVFTETTLMKGFESLQMLTSVNNCFLFIDIIMFRPLDKLILYVAFYNTSVYNYSLE